MQSRLGQRLTLMSALELDRTTACKLNSGLRFDNHSRRRWEAAKLDRDNRRMGVTAL
jgi:hypothetical protein